MPQYTTALKVWCATVNKDLSLKPKGCMFESHKGQQALTTRASLRKFHIYLKAPIKQLLFPLENKVWADRY